MHFLRLGYPLRVVTYGLAFTAQYFGAVVHKFDKFVHPQSFVDALFLFKGIEDNYHLFGAGFEVLEFFLVFFEMFEVLFFHLFVLF